MQDNKSAWREMVDLTADIPSELVRGDKPKGYDQVVSFLVENLRAGRLKVGDRLLAERELSQRLNVSRPLVREALRSLAMIGVLEIQQGRGTFVRSPDITALSDIFVFMFAQNNEDVDDIMEVRQGLERQAVRLACTRARTHDFEKMADALNQIEATIGDPIAGGRADFCFHTRLVEASHSPALIRIYGVVSRILEANHVLRRYRIQRNAEFEAFLIDHHRKLFEAISRRSHDDSEQILKEHFELGEDFRGDGLVREARDLSASTSATSSASN